MRELEKRLAKLEAKARQLPAEPASEREWRFELYESYFDAWARGLSLEDVSQEDADVEIWGATERYGPMVLGMIWEGILPGREELLIAGADFGRAEGCSDIIPGRVNPLPPEMLGKAP